jgi:hypothetical protein
MEANRVALAFLLGAGLGLGACVIVRPNPEARECTSACVERKNACLVAATTADAVARCDADHRTCMQPCLALPRHAADPGAAP